MKAMRDAYGEALIELGKINEDVVVLDADVSSSTKSGLFGKEFPERFFNIGIAEANMTAISAGMASCGKIPFINTFAFLLTLRAADPVRSLIAYGNLNVKIAGGYSGFSDSYDGASHQAVEDVAIMRAIPNMTVVTVADEHQAKKAVFAVAKHQGPVYLRLSRAEVKPIYTADMDFEIGKGISIREGKDVTIFANGYMVSKALDAAELLKTEGINASVVDMHTVKPLDKDLLLKKAAETGAIVAVEEHSIYGGLGSAIAEVLSTNKPTPLEIVGIQDVFGESGDYEQLLKKHGLDGETIAKAAKKVIDRKINRR